MEARAEQTVQEHVAVEALGGLVSHRAQHLEAIRASPPLAPPPQTAPNDRAWETD